MRFLRFLALPLLFSACALAQSSPAKDPATRFPPLQMQPAPHTDLQLSPATPQVGLAGRNFPDVAQTTLARAKAQATLDRLIAQAKAEPEVKVCYAIRSYAFARDGADPDATKFAGSSTCRPSSQLKFKGAVQLKVVR